MLKVNYNFSDLFQLDLSFPTPFFLYIKLKKKSVYMRVFSLVFVRCMFY